MCLKDTHKYYRWGLVGTIGMTLETVDNFFNRTVSASTHSRTHTCLSHAAFAIAVTSHLSIRHCIDPAFNMGEENRSVKVKHSFLSNT